MSKRSCLTRRVYVFKKGWLSGSAFGKKMATWDYRNVTGVQIETGVLSGTVAVMAAGVAMGDYSFWSTGKDDPQKAANALAIARDHFPQARAGVARLRELISAAQAPQRPHIPAPVWTWPTNFVSLPPYAMKAS